MKEPSEIDRTGINFFWGVDSGSTAIKVVLLDKNGNIVGKEIKKTLFPLIDHVRAAFSSDIFPEPPFDSDNKIKPDHTIVATGYGRHHIDFIQDKITEIKAHHLGVKKQLSPSGDFSVIDIGGQDAKIIESKSDKVHRFTMNRKCAAGTGAFIEELAHRLEIDLSKMTKLADKHDKKLQLSSYCTVFAVQEMVKILVSGEKLENLVQAVYVSIVSRVLEMTQLESNQIFLSGGVLENHPKISEILQARLPDKCFQLVPNAQFNGAIGAAYSKQI